MTNAFLIDELTEQTVIGILVNSPEQYSKLESILSPSDFYFNDLKVIFSTIKALYSEHLEISLISISAYLFIHKLIDKPENEIFIVLAEMSRNSRSAANIIEYAIQLRDKACVRNFMITTRSFNSMLESGLIPDALDFLSAHIEAIQKRRALISQDIYRGIEMDELIDLDIPERELILSPWLSKSGLAMIHAAPGIGKTHLALNIGYCVTSQVNFFGWSAPKKRNVLYADGEMPGHEIKKRLKAIHQSHPSSHRSSFVIMTPDLQDAPMPDLSQPQGQSIIESLIDKHEIELLIIDNLSCFVRSGVENDAESWLPIQTWLLRLRNKGLGVLLIHHQGKGGKQRGSSKKEDILDTIISLKRPSDYNPEQGARFIVEFEKTRGFSGDDAKSFEASLITNLNGVPCWVTKDLELNRYELAIELAQSGAPISEIIKETNMSRTAVYRCLQKAKENGRLKSSVPLKG